MTTHEERVAARHEAGTTRHLELPVAPEDAMRLIHEAVELRAPAMRLMREHDWNADVMVAGGYFEEMGMGNLVAGATVLGYGPVVHLSFAPFAGGTQFTARTATVGAMLAIRPEVHSLFYAISDAWDARERWRTEKRT